MTQDEKDKLLSRIDASDLNAQNRAWAQMLVIMIELTDDLSVQGRTLWDELAAVL